MFFVRDRSFFYFIGIRLVDTSNRNHDITPFLFCWEAG